jgi:hypothetical protein
MSTEITRELLQTTPLVDLPGWEVRLFPISYPPGAVANNHSHPVVGVGYVLEGARVSAFDDDREETFVAGQSFAYPASYLRIVRNGSCGLSQLCYGALSLATSGDDRQWNDDDEIGDHRHDPAGVAAARLEKQAKAEDRRDHQR